MSTSDTTDVWGLYDLPVKAPPRLKPCPFCGSPARYRMGAWAGPDRPPLHGVECTGCSVEGPSYSTRDEAVRTWNHRGMTAEMALRKLVSRCDGPEGVRADGSNIDTSEAHAALGDFDDEDC